MNIKAETVLSSLLHVLYSPHFTVTCFSITCATGIAIRSPEASYLLGPSTSLGPTSLLAASFLWNLSSLFTLPAPHSMASSINLTDFSSFGPFVGFLSLHDSHIAYSRV